MGNDPHVTCRASSISGTLVPVHCAAEQSQDEPRRIWVPSRASHRFVTHRGQNACAVCVPRSLVFNWTVGSPESILKSTFATQTAVMNAEPDSDWQSVQ